MEDIRNIELNNFGKEISSKKRISRKKIKAKTKIYRINYVKVKKNIIGLNIFISIALTILLAGEYSEMVKLSSDNLVKEDMIIDSNVQLNSLENMILESQSKNRIEKIAKNRLNMIYPTEESYVKLDSNQKIVDLNDLKTKNDKIALKSIESTLNKIFR